MNERRKLLWDSDQREDAVFRRQVVPQLSISTIDKRRTLRHYGCFDCSSPSYRGQMHELEGRYGGIYSEDLVGR